MESQIQKRSKIQKTFSLERKDIRPANPQRGTSNGWPMKSRQRNKLNSTQRHVQRSNRNSSLILEDDDAATDDYVADFENQYLRPQTSTRTKRIVSELDFVNLNCQIIVRPGTDVSLCLLEADVSVAWDKIVQVRYPLYEELECPVCLYPPTLPRMAQCGHVYCLACVTRYIGYQNEDTHKKCAICTHMFSLQEIVKVKILHIASIKPGDTVELSLIRRSKGSTKSVPFSLWKDTEEVSAITFEDEQLVPYAKMIVARNNDVCKIIEDEIDVLKSVIEISRADEWSENEVPELELLLSNLDAELKKAYESNINLSSNLDCKKLHSRNGINKRFSSPDELGVMFSALEIPEKTTELTHRGRKTSTCEDQCYFYYQVSDGRDVYMHAANWQCIVKEYPNRDDWPTTFKTTVVDVNHMRMDLTMRKRWRYLSHISLGRAFTIIELDLGPPIISRETLNYFAPMLERLRVDRQRRMKQDNYLSRLKEKVESQIPQMPENFVFAAPANLAEPINVDDFMPLQSGSKASTSTPNRPSFAAISRVGAASLVDKDRILHITKQPAIKKGTIQASVSFQGDMDWPSLGSMAEDDFQSMGSSTNNSWCVTSKSSVHPMSNGQSGAWGVLSKPAGVEVNSCLTDVAKSCGAWGRRSQCSKTNSSPKEVDENQKDPVLNSINIKEAVNDWPNLTMASAEKAASGMWGNNRSSTEKSQSASFNVGRQHNTSTSSTGDPVSFSWENSCLEMSPASSTLPVGSATAVPHTARSSTNRNRKRRSNAKRDENLVSGECLRLESKA